MASDEDDKPGPGGSGGGESGGSEPGEDRQGGARPLNPARKLLLELGRKNLGAAGPDPDEERRLDTELPEASHAWQTRRAGRLGTRYYNRHTRTKLGIWCTQLDVLAAVASTPEPIVQNVADRLDVVPCTLSRAVARLEDRGLLRREIRSTDRRRRYLVLTEEGRALLGRGAPLVHEVPQRRIRVALSQEHVVRVRRDSLALANFVRGQIRMERSRERDPSSLWQWEMRWSGASEADVERERKVRFERELERRRREYDKSRRGRGPP